MNEIKKYSTGDKVEKGKYRCLQCGHILYVTDDEEELPSCPKCPCIQWERVIIEHKF